MADPNKINLSNPNDRNTKKYLQELSDAICRQVVALIDWRNKLCDFFVQKETEEKESEFILTLKQQAEMEEMKQREAIQRIDASLSQPEQQQQIDELNKLKEELEELRKSLILQIHHLDLKMTQCDREIENDIKLFNQHSAELETLDANITEQVIAKIEKYGVYNATGERLDVDVEALHKIQTPSMSELYNDPSYRELLVDCASGREKQMRLIDYRRESIYQTFINAINPKEAVVPKQIVMGNLNNTQLRDACMKVMDRTEEEYIEKMSKMINLAIGIDEKRTGKNVDKEFKERLQQQLKTNDDILDRAASMVHQMESNDHTTAKKPSSTREK